MPQRTAPQPAVAAGASLGRGLLLLEVLGSEKAVSRGGLRVVEVARATGMDKSQVSRTLKALAASGLVERDPDTLEYRLGWRLFAYAAVVAEQRLLQAAPAALRRLVARLGERSHLTVLEGSRVVTLLSESPGHAVQAAAWIGRPLPVWNTSAGRALLADHEPDEVAALLAGEPVAADPAAFARFARGVAQARARGYAAVAGEFEDGLVAVAAPVRGLGGRIVAALNVSGPAFRFARRAATAGEEVSATARALSAQLGAP